MATKTPERNQNEQAPQEQGGELHDGEQASLRDYDPRQDHAAGDASVPGGAVWSDDDQDAGVDPDGRPNVDDNYSPVDQPSSGDKDNYKPAATPAKSQAGTDNTLPDLGKKNRKKSKAQKGSGPSAAGPSPLADMPAGGAVPTSRPAAQDSPYDQSSDPYAAVADPGRRQLLDAENNGGGLYNPNPSSGPQARAPLDNKDLKDAESQAASNQEDAEAAAEEEAFYNDLQKQRRFARPRAFLARNKKKGGLFAIFLSYLVSSFFVAMLLLIPLKIEHIITNLEQRFFASSTQAMSSMTRSMLADYLTHYAMPQYKRCGSATTRSNSCKVRIVAVGKNPVHQLYRGWADARVEHKLAKKGIVLEYKPHANKWYIKASGTARDGDSIGKDGKGLEQELNKAKDVRHSVESVLDDETLWKKIMWRDQVGRYLESKHGVKHCIFTCRLSDPFTDRAAEKKKAAKLIIVQRVITPREASLGIALECVLKDCDATKTEKTDSSSSPEGSGETENAETDTKNRTTLGDLSAKYPNESVDDMVKHLNEIEKKGFGGYLVERALVRIGISEGTSQAAVKAIPIIGWIDLASRVIHQAGNLAGNIKKLNFMVNAGAAAAMYASYVAYTDEIHTGNADAAEVGSLTASLGPGVDSKKDPVYGGTASAEDTPLYHSLMLGETAAPAKGNKAASDRYLCSDGKPVPQGKLVCAEEKFSGGNEIANGISDYVNNSPDPATRSIVAVSDIWQNTVGAILQFGRDLLGDVLGAAMSVAGTFLDAGCSLPIPPPGMGAYCDGKDIAKKAIPALMKLIATQLIPSPFSSNMSGGRTFDMIAAGADVSGNEYAHNGLGGRALSTSEANGLVRKQADEDKAAFQRQPFFARMFDTNTQYSLVSKMAMAVPFDVQASAQNGFASLMSNPFGSIGHGFASLFYTKTSATGNQEDPFGITQYGYTDKDLQAIGNPADYWDAHCAENADHGYQNDAEYASHDWNQAAADDIDPETKLPRNATVNPCMLIKRATGAAGALYDTSLLTDADKANWPGDNTSSGGATSAAVSGDSQQLAQQILKSKNVDTSYNASIKADLEAAAAGKNGTAGVPTSAAILQLIATLAQDHKVVLTAIQSRGQGHCNNTPKSGCPNDPHYTGNGVDFGSLDGVTLTGRNAPSITIIKQAFDILPKGSGIGQSQCGNTPSLPSGWITFNDGCNHLHVQVPPGTP